MKCFKYLYEIREKTKNIFFQFSKIFQGSLKMLFFKPYQPTGIKMRNIVDLNSIVVRAKCPYFLREVLKTTSSLFEEQIKILISLSYLFVSRKW